MFKATKRRMAFAAMLAFEDVSLMDNAMLIVWTRGQMNGLRATIKRLRMV